MQHPTEDEIYNPYAKVGSLWVPEALASSEPEVSAELPVQTSLTRQQRRYLERKRAKSAWVDGVSK